MLNRTAAVGAVVAAALAGCDTPNGPRDQGWLHASVSDGSGDYHGTGWMNTGELRPHAPPHFVLFSQERGAGRRSIRFVRSGSVVPSGLYAIGSGSDAVSATYTVRGGGAEKEYRATAGHVSFEPTTDDRMTGEFRFKAVLHRVCTVRPGHISCRSAGDTTDTSELHGAFEARYSAHRLLGR
jgi:hypothetical protein